MRKSKTKMIAKKLFSFTLALTLAVPSLGGTATIVKADDSEEQTVIVPVVADGAINKNYRYANNDRNSVRAKDLKDTSTIFNTLYEFQVDTIGASKDSNVEVTGAKLQLYVHTNSSKNTVGTLECPIITNAYTYANYWSDKDVTKAVVEKASLGDIFVNADEINVFDESDYLKKVAGTASGGAIYYNDNITNDLIRSKTFEFDVTNMFSHNAVVEHKDTVTEEINSYLTLVLAQECKADSYVGDNVYENEFAFTAYNFYKEGMQTNSSNAPKLTVTYVSTETKHRTLSNLIAQNVTTDGADQGLVDTYLSAKEAAKLVEDNRFAKQAELDQVLSALKSAITALGGVDEGEQALEDATNFKTNHATILAMLPEAVKDTDKVKIRTVLQSYYGLSKPAQELLVTEKGVIDTLLTQVYSLIANNDTDNVVETQLRPYSDGRIIKKTSQYRNHSVFSVQKTENFAIIGFNLDNQPQNMQVKSADLTLKQSINKERSGTLKYYLYNNWYDDTVGQGESIIIEPTISKGTIVGGEPTQICDPTTADVEAIGQLAYANKNFYDEYTLDIRKAFSNSNKLNGYDPKKNINSHNNLTITMDSNDSDAVEFFGYTSGKTIVDKTTPHVYDGAKDGPTLALSYTSTDSQKADLGYTIFLANNVVKATPCYTDAQKVFENRFSTKQNILDTIDDMKTELSKESITPENTVDAAKKDQIKRFNASYATLLGKNEANINLTDEPIILEAVEAYGYLYPSVKEELESRKATLDKFLLRIAELKNQSGLIGILNDGVTNQLSKAIVDWTTKNQNLLNNVTSNLTLLTVKDDKELQQFVEENEGVTLQWASSDRSVMLDNGRLAGKLTEDKNITMTASLAKNGIKSSEVCTVYVIVKNKDDGSGYEDPADVNVVNLDVTHLDYIMQKSLTTVDNIAVLYAGKNGSVITWETSDASVITDKGVVTRHSVDKKAKLTATVVYGTCTRKQEYVITVTATGQTGEGDNSGGINGGGGPIYPAIPPAVKNDTKPVDQSAASIAINTKHQVKNGNKVTLAIKSKDYTLYYSLNGGKYKKYTSALALPVGNNNIKTYIKDAKGNQTIGQSFRVEVAKPVAKKTVTVKQGKSFVMAITNKAAASKISYASSNKNIVLVSKNGKVVTKKKGTATITAKLVIGGKVTTVKSKIVVK